jgi:hypothetical protein
MTNNNKRLNFILTPDAQKLVDAGFVSPSDGSLTSLGRSHLWLIVMKNYNKEFVVEAEQVIEARKADK